jgi:hypothetical protein
VTIQHTTRQSIRYVAATPPCTPSYSGISVVIIFNVINPGLCHSELNCDWSWALAVTKIFLARTAEVGSRTLVAAGVAGLESHGKYMADRKVDDATLSEFARSQEGKEAGEKVWRKSSEILEGIELGATKSL